MTGWPTLADIVGEAAVKDARKHLGIKGAKADRGKSGRARGAGPLIGIAAEAGVELFHDRMKVPYAAVPDGEHRRVMAVTSNDFRLWLGLEAYRRTGTAPSAYVLDEAGQALAGRALYASPQRETAVRLAEQDGKLYLDLGRSAVEIDAGGWRVVPRPPVYFRRPAGTLELPEPARGGDLSALPRLLNVGGERNVRMVTGWMLGALWPRGPYPVLVVYGEQGSAKTTLSRALVSLTDPRTPPLRDFPRGGEDFAIWAQNAWVLGMDNLSDLSGPQNDLLCRMATGSGFGTRKFYSQGEEALFQASRPVLLNGIPSEMVSRTDLLDRTMLVELPPITDAGRRTEADVWAAFEAARPALLGALLDAVATGLREAGTVDLGHLPRMADFVVWVEACGSALGWKRGEFRDQFAQVRAELDMNVLGNWSVTPALHRLLGRQGSVEGTVSEVLDRLADERSGRDFAAQDWPRTPRGFGSALRRFAPALRRTGVLVEWPGHSNRGNRVRLSRTAATG